MNLFQTIDFYFGGEGSGCNPEVAEANGTRCGRPPKDEGSDGSDGSGGSGSDKPHYATPEAMAMRGNPKITEAEKNNMNFQSVYAALGARSDLTPYERDNLVVVTRAYIESDYKGPESYKEHAGPINGFSEERAKKHEEIINHYVSRFKPPKEHPVVVFTGGLPGAGKSVGLKQTMDTSKFLDVSADDIKVRLPGYNGSNAGYLHEESTMIADVIMKKAAQAKQDIIIDATMKSYGDTNKGFDDSTAGRLKALNDLGYDIHLQFTDVTIEKSISRVINRYVLAGRFLSPDVVRKSKGKEGMNSVNIENFMKYRTFPGVKSWKIFSTMKDQLELLDSGGAN